jgi:hypothetical protein
VVALRLRPGDAPGFEGKPVAVRRGGGTWPTNSDAAHLRWVCALELLKGKACVVHLDYGSIMGWYPGDRWLSAEDSRVGWLPKSCPTRLVGALGCAIAPAVLIAVMHWPASARSLIAAMIVGVIVSISWHYLALNATIGEVGPGIGIALLVNWVLVRHARRGPDLSEY